ncbi:hypothetical protein [Candidatus Methylomicrobium oryzae]|jgi:hypothetical protein|uniref:hypothetical protein n=1 Tax=Candidatus Methylomicrobium oryzae TaxID=2802053 RepID=UPI00192244DD|nr:hypothetical protein [Methylomicrobium sp. RS1]MBL1264966.1 hypothetical protein [Methylomicrobium sp. RS1]
MQFDSRQSGTGIRDGTNKDLPLDYKDVSSLPSKALDTSSCALWASPYAIKKL